MTPRIRNAHNHRTCPCIGCRYGTPPDERHVLILGAARIAGSLVAVTAAWLVAELILPGFTTTILGGLQ